MYDHGASIRCASDVVAELGGPEPRRRTSILARFRAATSDLASHAGPRTDHANERAGANPKHDPEHHTDQVSMVAAVPEVLGRADSRR